MSTIELFTTIQSSAIGDFIGKQNHLLGAVAQLLHIAGLILVLSSVLLVSLRLFGIGLRSVSAAQLADTTSKLVWAGLALLVVSGLVMFIPAALLYEPNTFFWTKFVLLALAIGVHLTLYRKVTRLDAPHAVLASATAIVALGLWFGVAFAGRFIGFF